MEPLNRRRLLGLSITATAGAILAACSSDSSSTATSTAASEAPTTTTAATSTTAAATSTAASAATRTIDTIHGAVEVPTAPQRIVALNFVDTATLLDLGITPVGKSTSGVNFLPEYTDQLAGVPEVTNETTFEYEVELIASLKPDLIIGSDWADAAKQYVPYEQLSAIAPTALTEWQQSAGNWPDQAAFFADVVGKSNELDELRSQYEGRADEIKASRADALAANTWALIQGGQGEWYFYTPQSSHGQVFARAGVQFADIDTGDDDTGYVTMSTERIDALTPAAVIALNANESAAAGAADLQGQPLFKALPAAQDGQVHEMIWFFPSSYKVAGALLEELDAALATLT